MLHMLHMLHTLVFITYFSHVMLHRLLHMLHTRPSTPYFCFLKKMMEETQTKTIRCTPENAREMQQMVKAWPELHALVQTLQAQNLFPGLRALSVTICGPESFVAGGVGAIAHINAAKRD